MQTVRQTILDIIDHLPEQAMFDGAKYALYIRQKLEKDLRDLDEGRNCMQESAEQHLLGQRTT